MSSYLPNHSLHTALFIVIEVKPEVLEEFVIVCLIYSIYTAKLVDHLQEESIYLGVDSIEEIIQAY